MIVFQSSFFSSITRKQKVRLLSLSSTSDRLSRANAHLVSFSLNIKTLLFLYSICFLSSWSIQFVFFYFHIFTLYFISTSFCLTLIRSIVQFQSIFSLKSIRIHISQSTHILFFFPISKLTTFVLTFKHKNDFLD